MFGTVGRTCLVCGRWRDVNMKTGKTAAITAEVSGNDSVLVETLTKANTVM